MAFQLAGILGFSQFGWPSTFWALGVGCFIVFILITVFGATTPLEHKFISEAEKKFIMGKLKSNCENVSIFLIKYSFFYRKHKLNMTSKLHC